jgi:hypothetical protein
MASYNGSYNSITRAQPGLGWEPPQSVAIRFGTRELSIGRDMRRRYYDTHPVIACRPGFDKGHLEVLLFRRWLLVLSKAR